jgi:hypothetical protein
MSNIFDLTKVKHLIETERPVCAVLLDTNVVMHFPSPEIWKVTTGPTIFIIPDGILIELEFLKERLKRNDDVSQETGKKAVEAIKSIRDLFCKGKISIGIAIPGGWVISVPSPKQSDLKTELNSIEDIVSAFKPSDAKYLLLTRECDEQLNTPVIMATRETNLFNIAQANGIPFRLVNKFPMDTPIEVNESIKDWNKALQEMDITTKQNSVEVEVFLTSKRNTPIWPKGTKSLTLAEGRGIVRDGKNNKPFIWAVPYNELILINSKDPAAAEEGFNSEVYIDFLNADQPEKESLLSAIALRLGNCASPSDEAGPLTFQSVSSLIYALLLTEYEQEGKPTDTLINNVEASEGLVLDEEWMDWTIDRDNGELLNLFQRFRTATLRSWTLGNVYTFRIMEDELNIHE